MANEVAINEYHKGEYIRILFYPKNRLGEALPAESSVVMTISETANGLPLKTLTEETGNITYNNPTTGEYLIEIFKEDVADLVEGRAYYYNLWAWLDATPTVKSLQAMGEFTLKSSIEIV